MTEYRFHSRPSPRAAAVKASVTLDAESRFHGAAIALREFQQRGCDLAAPLAHVDLTEAGGDTHTLLVEEVLEWLKDPGQSAFVQHENLAVLLR
jgi:hypothetical protein